MRTTTKIQKWEMTLSFPQTRKAKRVLMMMNILRVKDKVTKMTTMQIVLLNQTLQNWLGQRRMGVLISLTTMALAMIGKETPLHLLTSPLQH
jgi:hypothetical protein